jgi:hypothetical protein
VRLTAVPESANSSAESDVNMASETRPKRLMKMAL